MTSTLRRTSALVFSGLLGLGCDISTDPAVPAKDVRGTWTYVGDQNSPALDLEGSLVISLQNGETIGGTGSWEASDGLGGITFQGGNLTGQVIGDSDVDFDVTLSGGPRRHVARLRADTMSGVWVDASGGTSGAFRAVRNTP